MAESVPLADHLTALASQDTYGSQPLQQQLGKALGEVLHPAAVRFKFSIQQLTATPAASIALENSEAQPLTKRLWVLCKSSKSLDYALLAKPLTQQLRALGLTDFQDAIFRCESPGMPQSDWRMRIDLTPPAIMLQGWASWGDMQAITLLANLVLKNANLRVSGMLKNWRLHLFCCVSEPQTQASKFPNKQQAIDLIVPLLHKSAPQGIQGATIYGVQALPNGLPSEQESPLWVHWLELPGAIDPLHTLPPLVLAEQGNEQALTFVLQRLLNPDIEQCFTTGGIGLSLMYKEGLLHIMSEAPVCPVQSQIVDPVVRVLKQLAIPGVIGARIYGRIAGQQQPSWSHGVDFRAAPAQLGSSFEGIRPTEIRNSRGWRKRLFASNFFTPAIPPAVSIPQTTQLSGKTLLPWLLIGCCLVGSVDWLGKQFLPSAQSLPTANLIQQHPPLNNELLDRKLALYQQICATQGVPAVLIVGSSRALRGIDPAVLRQELQNSGVATPTIYNFGINGATAQVVNLLLRRLIAPNQLPKIVIWADGARAFNDGRLDQTFNTITSSAGYKQLTSNNNNPITITQTPLFLSNSYDQLDKVLNRALMKLSQTYPHRQQFKAKLQEIIPRWPMSHSLDSSSLSLPATIPGTENLNSDGFLPLTVQFNPTTYYQNYAKVTGNNDGDYANFTLTGVQDQAIRETAHLLQQKGIPLVFVNVPLSDHYLDNIRQKHEFAFKQYMQSLEQEQQLQFIDLVGSWMQEYSFYSDPSHLNSFGATRVSTYLVRNAPINWQILAPKP